MILSSQANQASADLSHVESDHYWRQASNFSEAWAIARERRNAPLQEAIYGHIAELLAGR
jgi:hypothetical protein